MKSPITTKQRPLYQQVAEQLIAEIQTRAIGSILPTEVELSESLAVSRHTIRAAMSILTQQGLVERVRRMGTRVLRHTPNQRYEQRMDGIDNVLEFAGRSVMHIQAVCQMALPDPVDPDMVGLMDATGACLQVTGVRRLTGEEVNCTWTQVFVPGRFAGIQALLPKKTEAMYRLIEDVYQTKVVKLLHTITAIEQPPYAVQALGLSQGKPVLEVKAWLYGQDDELIEFVRSIHNPAKVSIRMSTVQAS
ncbi:GntR family transcriptional regulator [Orrella sp. 11846]|uniref:GntR family transcriptional regulator n=1 Tax=Orrella sp. 11846 TaxID=3409913 RepID=UPI003B5C9188